jgi:hypothetical protein
MKKQIVLALLAFQMIALNAIATILINFDTDAFGNPIKAPPTFADTVRLTNLYAPLGIHFSGPGGNDGGAILDQAGEFGVDAWSGRDFLAFNRQAFLMDFGVARDPEMIVFDTLASNVSIYAAGPIAETFLMQGFDASGVLIAEDTVTTQQWSQLEISSVSGIKSVRLFVTGPDVGIPLAFVYDDLSVDFVPEPATISFLICVAALGLALRFRRKRPNEPKVEVLRTMKREQSSRDD